MTPHDGIWHDEVPALIFNSKQSRTVLLKLSSAVEVVRSLIFGAERIISEIQLKAGELHWGSKLEIPQLLESSSNPNKFLTPPFSQYLNKPLVHSQLQLNLNFYCITKYWEWLDVEGNLFHRYSILWADLHSVFEYLNRAGTYITLPPLIQQWIGPYWNIPNFRVTRLWKPDAKRIFISFPWNFCGYK